MSIDRPALYVVGTPIGNLSDISSRALSVLSQVDLVLCEDTRQTRKLLDSFSISTPRQALHEHNEQQVADTLVARALEENLAYALVSDAGMPLISDPGFRLVGAAIEQKLALFSVPGASALTAALSVAGLASDRFRFEGFPPPKKQARLNYFAQLKFERSTLIFYEAPHRIRDCIAAMREIFGNERQAVIAREITKRYESIYRGTLSELEALVDSDADVSRGELVVLVAGTRLDPQDSEIDRTIDALINEVDRKTATRLVCSLTGASRNQVYARIQQRLERD